MGEGQDDGASRWRFEPGQVPDRRSPADETGGRAAASASCGQHGELLLQELVAPEAGVPPSSLRIEDPDLGPTAGRTESAAGDHDLCPLADDVLAEADPGPVTELQPERPGLDDRVSQRLRQARRLEDDEHDLSSAGERR